MSMPRVSSHLDKIPNVIGVALLIGSVPIAIFASLNNGIQSVVVGALILLACNKGKKAQKLTIPEAIPQEDYYRNLRANRGNIKGSANG